MRLVRTFEVLGQKWQSFELEPGDAGTEHGLDDEDGAVTRTDTRRVVFRRQEHEDVRRTLSAHELLHVVVDASGAGGLIRLLAHAAKLDPEEVEEAFVVALAPGLAPLLESIADEPESP